MEGEDIEEVFRCILVGVLLFAFVFVFVCCAFVCVCAIFTGGWFVGCSYLLQFCTVMAVVDEEVNNEVYLILNLTFR